MKIKTFGKEYSYVLKHEQKLPEKDQTVWFFKLPTLEAQFDEGEEIEFKGDLTSQKNNKDITTKFKPANAVKKQATIIKACLMRIENLLNDDDQAVEWPLNNRSKDNSREQDNLIATLPPLARAELATTFRNAATISEEEVKN